MVDVRNTNLVREILTGHLLVTPFSSLLTLLYAILIRLLTLSTRFISARIALTSDSLGLCINILLFNGTIVRPSPDVASFSCRVVEVLVVSERNSMAISRISYG
ncbi:hypothetical protein BDW59DRAFT_73026 [Aspergillus cavernicola]|uniref:Uncharacterized protein n=1 Tax=Aspergillus cavernicola TaxID=176166 RepID=A0ABR4ICJ4_9EURO